MERFWTIKEGPLAYIQMVVQPPMLSKELAITLRWFLENFVDGLFLLSTQNNYSPFGYVQSITKASYAYFDLGDGHDERYYKPTPS